MGERRGLGFLILHLPLAVAVVWRWMTPAVDDWFAAGIGWWLLCGYGAVLALGWIALAITALRWRAAGGPTLPVKAADGDLALPQAWRAHLVAVGGVEISLGYRSQATGLLEAPSADQPASFGVRGDQASHDDATVAAWFADRLDVAQDTITVEPMGSGVTARFRRRVSWADAG